MKTLTVYFLLHHKGGYLAEGPFVDSDTAETARNTHDYPHQYDIVIVELPYTVWEFN